MGRDPLSVFLNEKTAAENAPSTVLEQLKANPPKQVTYHPDITSLDPGERALAGAAAIGGSLSAKILPWVADKLLIDMGQKGSHAWEGVEDIERAKGFGDALDNPKFGRKGKLLGLFNLKGRERALVPSQLSDRVAEVEGVVDSFIDKHKLVEKGVRLRLPSGLGAELGGSRYNPITKEVTLTRISAPIALHEYGHAADYTKGRIGKFRRFAEPMLQRGVYTALPIAMIAGDQIKEMLPGTIDDKIISYMQDHAPEIMGATLAATQLYPEAKASILATQHIGKMQGRAAAIDAVKKLAPVFGTYMLSTIPAIVGMSLARKYMREARAEKKEVLEGTLADIEKTSGIRQAILDNTSFIREGAKDIGHIARQINQQSVDLIRQPGTLRRVSRAAKDVGTSPEFVFGAMTSAVPASLAALYLYGTNSGSIVRARSDKPDIEQMVSDSHKGVIGTSRIDEEWREKHPMLFAGLVAAGAAMSGGILTKLFTDLSRVI